MILQLHRYIVAQIRLVGGQNNYEGRLEIFLGGAWGTVCDDSFGNIDASVVCRQLGLSGGMGKLLLPLL